MSLRSCILIVTTLFLLLYCKPKEVSPDVLNAVKELKSQGILYLKQKEYEKSKKYFEQVLILTEEHNLSIEQAKAYNNLAFANKKTGNIKVGIEFYNKAIDIYLEEGEDQKMAETSYNLGILYRKIDDLISARTCYLRAIKILEEKKSKYLAKCLNNLGLAHKDLASFDKSLMCYNKYMELMKKANNQRGIAFALHNIGTVYLKQGKYDIALENLNKSLEIEKKLESGKNLAKSYEAIANLLFEENRLIDSEKHYLKTWELTKKYNTERLLVVEQKIGELYLKIGDLAKTKKFLKASNESALKIKDSNVNDKLIENYDLLEKIANKEKNTKNAISYYHAAQKLRELNNNLQDSKNQQASESIINQARIDSQYKDKKTISVQLQIIIGLVLAVLASILVAYIIDSIKNKKSIKAIKEEQSRITTQMSEIRGLLYYTSLDKTGNMDVELIKETDSRMNAMMYVHDKTNKTKKPINISEYIRFLVENLSITFKYNTEFFRLNLELEEINIKDKKAIPIGIIVNEVLSGIFEYGFTNVAIPEMLIKAKKIGNHLKIDIITNGGELQNVYGPIVEDMLKELKTKLEIKTSEGYTCSFKVKV